MQVTDGGEKDKELYVCITINRKEKKKKIRFTRTITKITNKKKES